MFRRAKEKQSLIEESRKALREAENTIEFKNIRIGRLEKSYKDLVEVCSKQDNFINKVTSLIYVNKYSNEKALLSKIKELVSDYQSSN